MCAKEAAAARHCCGLMLACPILPVPLGLMGKESEFSWAEEGRKAHEIFHPICFPCPTEDRERVSEQLGRCWLLAKDNLPQQKR